MSIRSFLAPRLLLSSLAVLGCSSVSAHAAPQSRIKAAITDSDRATIRETISGRAKRATDLGEATSDRVLSAVTLHFSLTDAQQADLTQLLADQQNPSSPSYHKWLTPQQYGARFGLSSADLAKVQAWLTGKGLKIVEVPAGQNYIVASGSLSQVESAFQTRIHSFSENGERHISNVTDPVLPSAIANVIAGVTGLNDFVPRSRAVIRPHYTANVNNGTFHFLAPGDFHTIYNINPLLQQNINGSGIKIAIAGQTDISLTDVAAFRTAAGLPANPPQVVQVPNEYSSGTRSTGDLGEAHLDVEWAGAVAPSATILFVTVGANQNAGVFDALNYAISSNLAPIVSVSYGGCESSWSQSDIATLNLIFQQANAQGITVVGPSGDSGATDCDVAGLASEGLSVDFPASSPFVTGAGGTMFTADSSDSGTYWNSSNSGTSNGQYTSSAKQYIPEGPWNETASGSGLDAGGAGGGGVSGIFSKPAWQTGLGVPNDGARDVPDISLAAAANHDGYLFCEQGSCTNGFLNSSGNPDVVGGTSAASPAFAGMLALLEQKLGAGGLGNVNPTLYGLANTVANVFHDITTGNISVPCIQGTPNCPNGGSTGYSAGTGYDLASGLGSIDATSMVNNWTAAVPTGTANPLAPQCQDGAGHAVVCQTATTLQATTSAVCGLTSSSLPFNVAVQSANSSAPANPTGTVQLYVDNKPVGAPVALSGGTASLTLDTTSLASGQHNINALYSGDGTFAGSRGALMTNASNTGIVTQIDVTSTSSPDFSMTPCLNSMTVSSGSSASPVTLTLTPTAGFTGTVNLSVNVDTGDALNYTFSATPVTIGSGSAAITKFTLTATEPRSSAKLMGPLHRKSSGGIPWYVSGSGTALACLVLFTVPRRRRWGTLFALVLSVGAIGAIGCGGSGSSSGSSGGNGSGSSGSSTQAVPQGTYNVTVTATATSGGTTRTHSVVLTYNVR